MIIRTSSFFLALAVAGSVHAAPSTAKGNEAATARHLASLVAGAEPKTAELTMFFSQMPKGGDLHHHYSGALYAEQYLDWMDARGLCVDKNSYFVVANEELAKSQLALPVDQRSCMRAEDLRTLRYDGVLRELLQRWSSKDFGNHGASQPPPDKQFFSTFVYFDELSKANFHQGLHEIRRRAIEENVSYIETMLKRPEKRKDAAFDQAVLAGAMSDAALDAELARQFDKFDAEPAFNAEVDAYVAQIASDHAGIDDASFTMRYQTYVFRIGPPSEVFSTLVANFKAASKSPLIVGVNIVGQESAHIAMRDYALHMKMFRFLKTKYPNVKLALHAGELALGDVPPDGLRFHIDQALNVAGAERIGHGLDLAHESDAIGIMNTMRKRGVPVEINLTSNAFISGVKGENHPLTLYRKYGVPYVISTDDAGVTRHTLAQEYVLFASRYKPTYSEIKKTSYNSLRYSFLADADKKRLAAQLDQRYAAFEAKIAALAPKKAL